MNTNASLIFLNYRWLDSSDATGRIFDNLSSNLSKNLIFLDHENIDYGDSIPQRISDGLQNAKVLLVIIGKDWLKCLRERERSGKTDWVALEIKTAMATDAVRIVPVFLPEVDAPALHTQHPLLDELLTKEAYHILNRHDWHQHIGILADKIREWTLPEPEAHIRLTLQGRYQSDSAFTTIGFPADRDAQFKTFSMEDYFITPSYIPLDDLKKRGDWMNKEKESSSLKIRQQRLRLQNFIQQDYVSLRLLDTRENVLIIGNPGVGKSTFARWLCHQWAKNPEKYDALPFYIALREVSDMGVADFWTHIARLLKLKDIPAAMKIVGKMAHRIQWILDGYDELSQHKQLQLHKMMQGLLKGTHLRYALLSRPYGMLYDPGFVFDVRLQLDGFSYGQIVDYVRRFLQKNNAVAKEAALLRILRDNRVLEDYAHNPMRLSFIVNLFLTEAKPVQTLGKVQSQYQLQAMVYGWISAREIKKETTEKLPENLRLTDTQEAFAYRMELTKEFIHQGQKGLDKEQPTAISLSNMALGRMDTLDDDENHYRFSFNSVTFQEFLAARHLSLRITPEAFRLLCRDPFFWNFSKMLIGCLDAEQGKAMITRILTGLYDQSDTGQDNHFKFYLFAVQLSECSKSLVNRNLDMDKLRYLYQMYQMNAVYSPIWKSLLMEAIRKLYFKLDKSKAQKLKDWVLEDINPEGETMNLGEELNMFAVQDGVKMIVQQLELWNDPYFTNGILSILKAVVPGMIDDPDMGLYTHEPVSFMLDDVLAKCENNALLDMKEDLLPLLEMLPNEFIGTATRLKGMMFTEREEAWSSFLSKIEDIAISLKKSKKPGKRAQKILFGHLRAASELLFFCKKGRTVQQQATGVEIAAICRFFQMAGQLVQVANIEEYELEEVFQLSTESVTLFRETAVYQAVLDFAELVKPSYSGLVFADGDHFFQWFEQNLEYALAKQQSGRLFWFVNALTLADSLQSRFVKIRTPFGDLMRLYARTHRAVFERSQGTFTEVQFEEASDNALEVLRPFEKLVYFAREDSAWGEADKLALIDMALVPEFLEMRYVYNNFLPGLMSTQFSLYRQVHWNFVYACCVPGKLPVLFSVLRNKQLYRFGSNLAHLVRVTDFVHQHLDSSHLAERPALVIEMASRCLRLIKLNLETMYEQDAKDLLEIIQVILLNPMVQQRFLLEETIGALEGEDALAFVTCNFLIPNENLCFCGDYDELFGEHYRERRAFIEGLIEFFSDKDGIHFDDLRMVYPQIGTKMAEKLDWYIGVNEWEFRFEVGEFEGKLG